MNHIKWILLLIVLVAVTTPSFAMELTLGGYPSFFRTRARFINDATFLSALSDAEAQALGFSDADDNITFVDTRLRLTPQLILSDSVTIRAQLDVADNMIWGGANDALVRDVVFESLTPDDRFRGALLVGPVNGNSVFNSFFGAGSGVPSNPPVDDVQFFNVRMLHVDIVLPSNWGFIRVGRQTFDWGLGLLANGGWDPSSDLGFVVDRLLYLKSWPFYNGTFTFIFFSDRFRQGTSLVNGSGDGWDGGALATVYNRGGFTLAGYFFPYIHQTNVFGTDLDVDRATLWSFFVDYKADFFRLVGEMQQVQGKLTGAQSLGLPDDEIDVKASNLIFALRAELYPRHAVRFAMAEFGFANGDEVGGPTDPDLEGSGIAFNPAYNLDNLLFKHIIPNIYGLENSVINAYYIRATATARLTDRVSFTPQVIFAWNEERQALVQPGFFVGESGKVDRFLGTELEGIFSIEVVPGVNFDFIGSVVIPGSGLDDLIQQRAAIETCERNPVTGACVAVSSPGNFDAPDAPFTFQGRLTVYIDQFFSDK